MNVMLDHSANEVNKKGNEVYVAQQEVEVTPDKSANFLEYGLWGAGIALVIYIFATKPSDAGLIATIFKALCALIPAGWFFWQKKQTESYFAAHQQKIQAAASEIDNYTANRAKILIDIYELTHGAIRLDKDVMTVDEQDGLEATIYPNPTNNQLTIACVGMKHITLISVTGETLYEAEVDADKIALSLNEYPSGMYFIRIQGDEGTVTKKFTITK